MTLTLEALGRDRFEAFADLLGREDFGGCFCAVWTAFGDDWGARCADPARPNLAETRRRVEAGDHVGFLVRDAGAPTKGADGQLVASEPIAWTGSGPRSAFPLLESRKGARLSPQADDVWCIGCIAIRADRRGGGLSARIVEAVIDEARRAGARAVEAYPTRPWDEPRSYRGALSTFERAGFQVIGSEPDGESEVLLLRRSLTA